uniref:MalT-like TPR region domain-containing protein n=1 Tax=Chromera velia CCMP2878 TaxID=1169474 RepID=A0A0G4I4P1_9ALVE|eukprot:Cvel_10958.t1-p1 / transcript=Cvel_10958.t1 / gene=Cvel_10958 / organism=Chromera_velia_CCMP2878 / gene_product=hypothetical protein / transcript_product=hypothetical protein / location=Cvel_scaffold674:5516-11828(+) / protein_length=441 / sequence_SO=supercontig / SO=protein_coding / is_pseudo=false
MCLSMQDQNSAAKALQENQERFDWLLSLDSPELNVYTASESDSKCVATLDQLADLVSMWDVLMFREKPQQLLNVYASIVKLVPSVQEARETAQSAELPRNPRPSGEGKQTKKGDKEEKDQEKEEEEDPDRKTREERKMVERVQIGARLAAGSVLAAQQRYQEALTEMLQGVGELEEIGETAGGLLVEGYGNVASLYAATEQWPTAIEWYRKVLSHVSRTQPDPQAVSMVYLNLAQIYQHCHEWGEAEKFAQEAVPLLVELYGAASEPVYRCLRTTVQSRYAQQKLEGALVPMQDMVNILNNLEGQDGQAMELVKLYGQMGNCYENLGNAGSAYRHYLLATEQASKAADRPSACYFCDRILMLREAMEKRDRLRELRDVIPDDEVDFDLLRSLAEEGRQRGHKWEQHPISPAIFGEEANIKDFAQAQKARERDQEPPAGSTI